MRAFEASARLGSHRKAAKELHVDHTVISKHLRNLESELGVALLNTTPSGTVLTAAGSDYYYKIADALESIAVSTAEIRQRGPHPNLHVACSPGLAMFWLMPRMLQFFEQHPTIEIALNPTLRVADLRVRAADIDLRYMEPGVEGTKHAILGRPRVFPVASQEWLARHGKISRLEDFLDTTLVHEETHEYWQIWLKAAGIEVQEMPLGPRYWSAALAINAAKRGQGIALANDWIVSEAIAAGELVEVLETNVVLYPYLFVTQKERWDEPSIATFRDWVIENIKNSPRA